MTARPLIAALLAVLVALVALPAAAGAKTRDRDHEERRFAADPRDADTDGDGTRDGQDADATRDLGLTFSGLLVERTNGTGAVRVRMAVGERDVSLTAPGNSSVDLDIPDASPTRDSLEVSAVFSAEDLATGTPLALFEDPRGAIVVFDLVNDRVSGIATGDDPHVLRFTGADGTITLAWAVDRD